METHGSALTFGVGELGPIVHRTLEVDGRTMAHFFIFEVVIIMNMGPIDRSLSVRINMPFHSPYVFIWHIKYSKKVRIGPLSYNFYAGLDPFLFIPSSRSSSASKRPSRCIQRIYSLMNGS